MSFVVKHILVVISSLTIPLRGSDKKCGSENRKEPAPRIMRPAAIYLKATKRFDRQYMSKVYYTYVGSKDQVHISFAVTKTAVSKSNQFR